MLFVFVIDLLLLVVYKVSEVFFFCLFFFVMNGGEFLNLGSMFLLNCVMGGFFKFFFDVVLFCEDFCNVIVLEVEFERLDLFCFFVIYFF